MAAEALKQLIDAWKNHSPTRRLKLLVIIERLTDHNILHLKASKPAGRSGQGTESGRRGVDGGRAGEAHRAHHRSSAAPQHPLPRMTPIRPPCAGPSVQVAAYLRSPARGVRPAARSELAWVADREGPSQSDLDPYRAPQAVKMATEIHKKVPSARRARSCFLSFPCSLVCVSRRRRRRWN